MSNLEAVKRSFYLVNPWGERGQLCLYASADGGWSVSTNAKDWLNTEIEKTCRQLGIASNSRLINEVRTLIERDPTLQKKNVPWDQHGQVPTRSGLIHPTTLELTPMRPEHYVTWRVECNYDPEASCPTWMQMLEDAFADFHDVAINEQELVMREGSAHSGMSAVINLTARK